MIHVAKWRPMSGSKQTVAYCKAKTIPKCLMTFFKEKMTTFKSKKRRRLTAESTADTKRGEFIEAVSENIQRKTQRTSACKGPFGKVWADKSTKLSVAIGNMIYAQL